MDIGGYDITIPTSVSRDTQVRLALSFLRGIWPDGVMDQTDKEECLFYQSIEVKRDWDINGRTDTNCDKMIHFITGKGHMTLVFDKID